MTNPVKWGIISTADINRKVIPGARASDQVELVAVASRNQQRADEYANQWDIPRAFGAYEDLLADPEIEAVYISLPNTMHCDWSMRALEAGKHVLCEKPLSRHPEEVVAAFDTADRTGRHLSEAFMYRHNPQTKRVQELVAEGAIGAAPPRPLRLQLLALRPRQHPAADRRRRRGAHGRRLLQRERLTPARRRARAGLRRRRGSARPAPTGSSRERSASRTTCSRPSTAALRSRTRTS